MHYKTGMKYRNYEFAAPPFCNAQENYYIKTILLLK